MPTLAKTGHGATVAYEQAPSGSPGVFTVVAELSGDLEWALERAVTSVMAHNYTIDHKVVSGMMTRPDVTFDVNFVYDNATHSHATTGLQYLMEQGTETGFRLRGPSGATDTDEWICSGFVIAYTQTNPVNEGVRSAQFTIALSGPMIIDGATFGANAF